MSLRFTSLYAPNSPTKAYFQEVTAWFAENLHELHFIGGDFNTTTDDLEDLSRSCSQLHHPLLNTAMSNLRTFTEATKLADIWRQFNPSKREYTNFTHVHSNLSRINYVLGTPATLPIINHAQIHEIAI